MSCYDNKNLELISLIWLDNMADATQENREIQDKLRSAVNYLRTFDNCQTCEHYIRNIINDKQDKIILIVSGKLGQEIIDKIHHLKQIISIFVFCFDKDRNELWANNYKKIRGVIVTLSDLLKQIDLDRKSDEQKLNESIDIFKNKDEIIPLLLQIDSSPIDKRSLLKICFKEYEGNLNEFENIRDFEHLYSSSNALDWFFNETFLYRLLIRALHVFNIEIIFLLRFFLQDIEQQLRNCLASSEIVYRGQLMTNDQLEFLNNSIYEKNLRFNSFMIANQNKEQVLKSLLNTSNTNGLNRVLFEIDSNQIGKKHKEFVIFPITTCFHITSIEIDKQIRIVKIKVFNTYKLNEKKTKNSFQLAHLLRHIGRLDQSEKLFYLLLDQYPSLNFQSYDGLGRIAQDKGLYELSLNFYMKSFETVPFEHRAHCLNNIGCAYDYLEKYEDGLQYYGEALTLMTTDLDQAMCLSNMGITYAKNEQYQQALQCFQQSLSIRERKLSENHVDIGISYTNLGVIWSTMGELDHAFEHFNLALKSFSVNDFEIFRAIVYQNMAKIFQEKTQFDRALTFYQDAEKLFQQHRSIDHPNLIYIQQQIQQLKQQQ
ncbi:unnamed protein product [Rotaria socialis]|uniref:Uncharacterized protein n=1 Tax=Rotaria socialis TaxID=392032 RepID=A0A820L9P9_9BILA|nr:unnamed protein product [Rotaria socialis]CAF4352738.1 unnamed protein product [Rotaria socialis]